MRGGHKAELKYGALRSKFCWELNLTNTPPLKVMVFLYFKHLRYFLLKFVFPFFPSYRLFSISLSCKYAMHAHSKCLHQCILSFLILLDFHAHAHLISEHFKHVVRHGLVVRIPGSHPGGPGSIPGVGIILIQI